MNRFLIIVIVLLLALVVGAVFGPQFFVGTTQPSTVGLVQNGPQLPSNTFNTNSTTNQSATSNDTTLGLQAGDGPKQVGLFNVQIENLQVGDNTDNSTSSVDFSKTTSTSALNAGNDLNAHGSGFGTDQTAKPVLPGASTPEQKVPEKSFLQKFLSGLRNLLPF